jgi:pimeloyl-ACP methyl ester carboxylesterase
VLILASPLASCRPYAPLVRVLSTTFTVVVLELPGSGGSIPLRTPWTSRQYGAFVAEVIRVLPLGAPVVIGHGASATIAIEASCLSPRDVSALVLADPSRRRRRPPRRGPLRGRAARALARAPLGAGGRGERGPASRELRVPRPRCARAAVLDLGPSVTVPTMLAWSARRPLSLANAVAAALGAAQIVLGEASNRDWIAAKPAAFAAHVRRFVVRASRRCVRSAPDLRADRESGPVPTPKVAVLAS